MQARKPIAIAAAAVAAVTVAGTVNAQDPAPTLELVAPNKQSKSTFVDAPPKRRESAGDMFTIASSLRDAAGRRAGRLDAVFTQTSRARAQGSVTFALQGGQIVAVGALDAAGRTDSLVVAGGSGAYAGATGSVSLAEERNATRFRLYLGE